MPILDIFYFNTADMLELAVELFIVLICSGAIGFERELKNRPAGLRTHMIVATTAMLIMHIGGNLAEATNGAADPGRMAAQVVSGRHLHRCRLCLGRHCHDSGYLDYFKYRPSLGEVL